MTSHTAAIGWRPTGSHWETALAELDADLRAEYVLDEASRGGAQLLRALAELQTPLQPPTRFGLLQRAEHAPPEQLSLGVSESAFGLLLRRRDGTFATSLEEARGLLTALWAECPDWEAAPAPYLRGPGGLEAAEVRDCAAAAKQLCARVPRRAVAAARPAAAASAAPRAPRPVSAPGQRVTYLTDEQKAALNAKYGKLETPTVEDMHKTISAASDCRLS